MSRTRWIHVACLHKSLISLLGHRHNTTQHTGRVGFLGRSGHARTHYRPPHHNFRQSTRRRPRASKTLSPHPRHLGFATPRRAAAAMGSSLPPKEANLFKVIVVSAPPPPLPPRYSNRSVRPPNPPLRRRVPLDSAAWMHPAIGDVLGELAVRRGFAG
jgi:hypothetical protein